MALSATLNITQRKYFLSELGLNNHKFISRLASVNIFDRIFVIFTFNDQLKQTRISAQFQAQVGCSEGWKI